MESRKCETSVLDTLATVTIGNIEKAVDNSVYLLRDLVAEIDIDPVLRLRAMCFANALENAIEIHTKRMEDIENEH